jgi:hypothetical protein
VVALLYLVSKDAVCKIPALHLHIESRDLGHGIGVDTDILAEMVLLTCGHRYVMVLVSRNLNADAHRFARIALAGIPY